MATASPVKPTATAAPAGAQAAKPPAASSTAGKPVTPPFKIESVQSRQRHLKFLVYGDYGVGKTFLLGTAADVPQMRDVLFINAEAGDLTFDIDEHNFGSIDTIRVRDYKMLGKVHEYLKLHCSLRERDDEAAVNRLIELEAMLKDVPEASIKEPRRYQTVILDSLTEIEQYCMYQLLGITDATKLDEETATAEWAEYKRQHSMVQRLIRNFRDLPMNILMTCARSYVQDESKRMVYSPQMTGKLSNQVQGFMDLVGYYVIGQINEADGTFARRLHVQPTGRFSAKCRFSRYKKPYFDNPTMKSILSQVGLLNEAK